MRLINADKLQKDISVSDSMTDDYGVKTGYAICMHLIDEQPTIEERKTGKWMEFDSDEDRYDIIKCPRCKHTFTVDSYHWTDIGFVKDDFKFCPNCGLKMEGAEPEDIPMEYFESGGR